MIVTEHAKTRLWQRYEKWGLNVPDAIQYLSQFSPEEYDNYILIIFDEIPIILACDEDIIKTVYPHPFDEAAQHRDLMNRNDDLHKRKNDYKNKYFALVKELNNKDKYIDKLHRKLKNQDQKLKRYYCK